MRHVLAAILCSAAFIPACADAQVVIMRKPFTTTVPGVGAPPTTSPTPTPQPTPTPTPAPQTGSWTLGAPVIATPSCGDAVPATRDVWCAAADGTRLSDGACSGPKPSGASTASDTRSCTYDWRATDWSAYSSSCSAAAERSRQVSCVRSDGKSASDALCDAASRPDERDVSPVYSSCSHAWKAGDYLDPGSSCTSTETQTRSVVCTRTLDGATVSDASCDAATRPESTTVVADYSACQYRAVDYGAWTPASTCSSDTTKSRTAKCQRSDGNGTIVADTECTSRGVALTETVPDTNYSTCSYSWSAGEFLDPGSSCTSSETQTRSVTCVRDLDKALSDDVRCDAPSRPSSTRTVSDYSSCTYGQGTTTDFGDWDSHCSATAKRTRRWTCWRSDGTVLPDAECTSRGVDLVQTETAAVYDQCAYSWKTGAFIDPGASCTANETQTRTVTCQRDLDGAAAADGSCNASTKPTSTQSVADYSACTYSKGALSEVGSWSSSCSANATRTRTYQCQRADGAIVPDSECSSRGIPLSDTETGAVYTGCSYSWTTGQFVSPGPSCEPAQTQTRSVTCTRSLDGATVADSFCTGTRPTSTQTVANYDDCANNLTWYPNSAGVGHMLGEAANGGWYAQPSMGAHHMWYGPYVYRIKPGTRTVTWTMQLHDVERDANGVVYLDVYDATTQQQITGLQILRSNFGGSTGFVTFSMQYQQTAEMATHPIEYRAYYQAVARVTIASVSVN